MFLHNLVPIIGIETENFYMRNKIWATNLGCGVLKTTRPMSDSEKCFKEPPDKVLCVI